MELEASKIGQVRCSFINPVFHITNSSACWVSKLILFLFLLKWIYGRSRRWLMKCWILTGLDLAHRRLLSHLQPFAHQDPFYLVQQLHLLSLMLVARLTPSQAIWQQVLCHSPILMR